MNLEEFKKKYGVNGSGLLIKSLLNEKHNGMTYDTATALAKDLTALLDNPFIEDLPDFKEIMVQDTYYLQVCQHADKSAWLALRSSESYPEGSLLWEISKVIFDTLKPCINMDGVYYWGREEKVLAAKEYAQVLARMKTKIGK